MTYKEIIQDAENRGVNFDLQYEEQKPLWGVLDQLAKKYKYKHGGENNRIGKDFFYWLMRSKINETDSSSSGAYQAPFGVSQKDLNTLNNMKETIKEAFALYKNGDYKNSKWSGGKLVKIYDTQEEANAAKAAAKKDGAENLYIVKKEAKSEDTKTGTKYKVMVNGKAHGDGNPMSKEKADELAKSLKSNAAGGANKAIKVVPVTVAKSKVMKEGREYNYITESYVFENKKYTKVLPMTETKVYTKQALTEALNRKKKI